MPTVEADFCPCCRQSPCREDLEIATAAAPETPSFPGQDGRPFYFCANCGASIDPEAIMCRDCGACQ